MQKRKIDLVFRVLQILVTSALFRSIVTYRKIQTVAHLKTPTTGLHWPLLPAHLDDPLSLKCVCLYVILSNDGSSGNCWTSKYHQNHQVPAVCRLCICILVRQQGVCNLCVYMCVESIWLHHLPTHCHFKTALLHSTL